jgi:hypothetical protein
MIGIIAFFLKYNDTPAGYNRGGLAPAQSSALLSERAELIEQFLCTEREMNLCTPRI